MKLAINGFGRIGRQVVRILIDRDHKDQAGLQKSGLVAINDLSDPKTLAHLLKYDSIYGPLSDDIKTEVEDEKKGTGQIIINGYPIQVLTEPDPAKLPWKELGVEVVIESTGEFTKKEDAAKHITAGAKKVILSAPPKGGGVSTYIIGVNSQDQKNNEAIISNSSCTTNSVAPVAAIIQSNFGVEKATMTTIHAYTADQRLQDAPHKDLRRARAASANIVPTTTGAAVSTGEVIPELKGLFDGMAIRVPVITGSLSDFTFLVKKPATIEQVNQAIIKAADENPRYKGILTYTSDPIVSSDVIGNPHSSIVDLTLTKVIDSDLVKVVSWYDNEWGYTQRLVEMALAER